MQRVHVWVVSLLTGTVLWVVSLTATSVVSGGLLANLIHVKAWVGTNRTRRLRATIYSALLLASLTGLALLARQSPWS